MAVNVVDMALESIDKQISELQRAREIIEAHANIAGKQEPPKKRGRPRKKHHVVEPTEDI